jgi:beta-N-acetylhexosaminidase
VDGKTVNYTQAAMAALMAGCDMVLLCNQSSANSEGGGSAIDELIAGVTEAQVKGQWQASDASELRRRALLPATPAVEWAALMVQPAYMHALDWIA